MKKVKKELTCRVVSIRDTATGEVYDGSKLRDPVFKKEMERRITENIARAIGN